jgi:large subunit ribosomal protein L17
LGNKESVKALFGEVASKIADRPGGYTRIIKLAETRQGDNAEVCLMELVDFNTLYTKESAEKKAKTRRGRGKKKEDGETEASASETTKEATAKPKAEKKAKTDAPKKAAPKKDKK